MKINKLNAELVDCIGYYLSETVENLSDWDCEHLAMGLMNSFEIKSKRRAINRAKKTTPKR
jgi:hypothetical protein